MKVKELIRKIKSLGFTESPIKKGIKLCKEGEETIIVHSFHRTEISNFLVYQVCKKLGMSVLEFKEL
jgi:hypothetical protein